MKLHIPVLALAMLLLHTPAIAQPVIQNPRVVLVLWNGPSGHTVSAATESKLAHFYSQFAATVSWMTPYYGVHNGVYVYGLGANGGWPITPGNSSTSLTDGDVQVELASQITNGHLPYDLLSCDGSQCNTNYVYMVHLPVGVTERDNSGQPLCQWTDPQLQSGHYICGYHNRNNSPVQIGGVNLAVRYAVMRDFSDFDCYQHNPHANRDSKYDALLCDRSNTNAEWDPEINRWSIQGTGNLLDNLTFVASHELAEALADPDVTSTQGEIGDQCASTGPAGKTGDPFIGQLGDTSHLIQYLQKPDSTCSTPPCCYLQCSDTVKQCSVEARPELILSVVNSVLN